MEVLGDRWSLLIVRDLMVRGYTTFKEFQDSGEGIATNILADRLEKLQSAGIIESDTDEADGRRIHYRLTEKGIDLAPVVMEMVIWAGRHEQTSVPDEFITHMASNRQAILADVRRRWELKDRTPLIPKFREKKERK